MVKKLIGLSSLLLIITFIGAACAPTASQRDLQELQYQVQALSQSLATTQSSLQAAQATLQTVQLQNQQLQEQLKQTSSTCSTCEKTAQACINNVVSPYVCASIAPYCPSPCSYPSPCSTPIAYPPCSWLYSNYYFLPYPHFTHYGPWGYHPFPPPAPHPGPSPFPPPPPHPWPWTSPSVTLPPPVTAFAPATEPMAASAVSLADISATAPTETTTEALLAMSTLPAVTDTVELAVEPAPAPEIALDTASIEATVPDLALEETPSALAAVETPVITEIPAVPETLLTPEATNESVPDATDATETSPETIPAVTDTAATATEPMAAPDTSLDAASITAAVSDQVVEETPSVIEPPLITAAPAEPAPEILQTETVNGPATDIAPALGTLPETTLTATDSAIPAVETAPGPDNTLSPYPVPPAIPVPVLEAMPPVPSAADYPVISEAPIVPAPEMLQTTEATNRPIPDLALNPMAD
ncbi:MAG: hypothetical protein MUO89_04210 [Dehalococcoidia bacterium]|nr:hypothetical protein [Dehalococcoidia bacterium]